MFTAVYNVAKVLFAVLVAFYSTASEPATAWTKLRLGRMVPFLFSLLGPVSHRLGNHLSHSLRRTTFEQRDMVAALWPAAPSETMPDVTPCRARVGP